MNIAICTDSSAGISQIEAHELGIRVIGMPYLLDGVTYYEAGMGETGSLNMQAQLTREEFFAQVEKSQTISTSMPTPGDIMDVWDDLLSKNDVVLYVSMSSGLSGTYQAAHMLSLEDDYAGHVFVIDSRGVSVTERQMVLDVHTLAHNGFTPEEICRWAKQSAGTGSIYISLQTLSLLKKGGRITPAAAALGSMLRIRPVLSLMDGGRLDSCATARNMAQSKVRMLHFIQEDLNEKFHDGSAAACQFAIAYSDDREAAYAFADQIRAAFPNRNPVEIILQELPVNLCCHIGPGGLGIGVWRIMDITRVRHELECREAS